MENSAISSSELISTQKASINSEEMHQPIVLPKREPSVSLQAFQYISEPISWPKDYASTNKDEETVYEVMLRWFSGKFA